MPLPKPFCCAALFWLAASAAPVCALTVSDLVVFGDGNVDIGRAASDTAAFDKKVPAPGTVGGRSSDGLLLPEYLAMSLGIGQLNFAVRGATSGTESLGHPASSDLVHTGLLSQVAEFASTLGGAAANPGALYLLWAGASELAGIDHANTAAVTAAAYQTRDNLHVAVTQLAAMGARTIVVAGATPRPYVSDADSPVFEPGFFRKPDSATRQLNIRLRELAADLDTTLSADVAFFDSYTVVRDLIGGAGGNGFAPYSQLTSGYCVNSSDCAGLINWDAHHKTSAVHAVLAERFIADLQLLRGDIIGDDSPGGMPAPVPLPASTLLLGAALAAFGWLRLGGRGGLRI